MESKTYEIDNLAIASYFEVQGLKYLGSKVLKDNNDRDVVWFIFEDLHSVGRDIERSFRNSKEKKYWDSFLFFRSEIFKTLKSERK